jgi:glycosyltransferase involved in cell wall biosynthesis
MKRMLMFVYNDLNTDARVQRAAEVISDIVDLEVLSIGDEYSSTKYKTTNIKSSTVSNIFKYFDVLRKIVKWSMGRKYDILYAHDFSSSLPALYMKAFKKCNKLVYDAHELYIPQKGITFSLRDKFFYQLEKVLIKKSDLIICAQEKRGEIMRAHYGLQSKPVIIRNISKLPLTDSQLDPELQKKCNEFFLKKGTTVVYAGALVANRKLDELISTVSQLGQGFKLLFVGGGSDKERLQDLTKNYPLLTCCFLGNVPYVHLSKVLKRCDIGYLFYPTDIFNNIYCASNKVYEYASINLPIVANKNPTLEEIFNKWEIGICTSDLQIAIKTIITNMDKYKSNCIIFNNENRWENEAVLLIKEVKSVLKKT